MAFPVSVINGDFSHSFDPFALEEESLSHALMNTESNRSVVTAAMILATRAVTFEQNGKKCQYNHPICLELYNKNAFSSAFILPVTNYNNQGKAVLLGLENDGKYSGEFNLIGGKMNDEDNFCYLKNAIREAFEESCINLANLSNNYDSIEFKKYYKNLNPDLTVFDKYFKKHDNTYRYLIYRNSAIFMGYFPELNLNDLNQTIVVRKKNSFPHSWTEMDSLDWFWAEEPFRKINGVQSKISVFASPVIGRISKQFFDGVHGNTLSADFHGKKKQNNNNILLTDEDLRLEITGANKFQFPPGLILFHTGKKTKNQFRNKSCCFFTSLLPHSVDYYFESALDDADSKDEIEVRTYVLKRSVTMYQWYFTDLADMIHRKNNPEKTELQRGSEEFKNAEYEGNYAFEKFGLDGKYSQDSNELMFTTQSMDALVEMSEEFSMMLYLFIKNLLCDDDFKYAKRFPNILRLSYPERLLFLDYIQAMEQFMVHEGLVDDSTAFTGADYGGEVENETKLLATVHRELMMFFAERDKKFRVYLMTSDRAKIHPDLGKLIVPDTKTLEEKYDYVEVTQKKPMNEKRIKTCKKTFGNLIFRIEQRDGGYAYYIDIPEVKCTFTIASISGVVYNNFVVPDTTYPNSYKMLDTKIEMIGGDYTLFERLFKPADLAPPEYFSEVPASFRISKPTYEELLQIKTDFLQYFRVMEPVPIEEAVLNEERAAKRAKK